MTITNDTINLVQSDLDNLPHFATEQNHTESNLYLNKNLVLKIFKNRNDIALMKNKEKKIDFLKTSNIEELILPKHKIYIDNLLQAIQATTLLIVKHLITFIICH